jgi:hypothetical protein
MPFEKPNTSDTSNPKKAIDFIKQTYPNLVDAKFITDKNYHSPEENDVKVVWSDYLHDGCFQVMEFSEQQGKTFQVSFYLKPKGGSFEIIKPSYFKS